MAEGMVKSRKTVLEVLRNNGFISRDSKGSHFINSKTGRQRKVPLSLVEQLEEEGYIIQIPTPQYDMTWRLTTDARIVSILPLDVGFDPRATDTPVLLESSIIGVRYLDPLGKEQLVCGSMSLLISTLEKAGYKVERHSPIMEKIANVRNQHGMWVG